MATRQQVVEAVAGQIADRVWGGLVYDADADIVAEANRINRVEGWTVELSAPLGHTLRCEGIVLSETEMATALELAEQWALGVETR